MHQKEASNMEIINIDYRALPTLLTDISLCLGYFDGIHKGHASLINFARKTAKYALGILTFSTPISRFINNGKSSEVLTSIDDRKRLLYSYDIDYLLVLNIDENFMNLSRDDFINQVLIPLNVKEIFVGEDYRFGKDQAGDAIYLTRYFNTHIISLLEEDNRKISTREIIELIRCGDIKNANKLLGHSYEVTGKIVHGFNRGKTIGFPTANVALSTDYVLPRFGVYKTLCYLRGIPRLSITNVGVHPTVGALDKPIIEIFIKGINFDIYGERVYLAFLDFVRDEKKFSNIDELKEQIEKDLQSIEVTKCEKL